MTIRDCGSLFWATLSTVGVSICVLWRLCQI